MKRLPILLLLLCLVSVSFAQTRVILVRHAEKQMTGDNPGLTAEGMERAEALSHVLSAMSIDALYSTPYVRTQATLKPLSERTNLQIQEYPPLNREEFMKIISGHEDQTIVFSGHSNTVPALLNLMSGEDTYQTFPEWQYDDLFIVTIDQGGWQVEILPLKYGRKSIAP